jgi:ubiquinone biosynthesis protein Coq4
VRIEEPHPYNWFGRRVRDTHDIWHILSGYHRDGLGEACLVAFSYAQTRGLGWATIALGAGFKALTEGQLVRCARDPAGLSRGKAAKWLPGEDAVRLMSEPLDAARRRLNITPPTQSTTPFRANSARHNRSLGKLHAETRRTRRKRKKESRAPAFAKLRRVDCSS